MGAVQQCAAMQVAPSRDGTSRQADLARTASRSRDGEDARSPGSERKLAPLIFPLADAGPVDPLFAFAPDPQPHRDRGTTKTGGQHGPANMAAQVHLGRGSVGKRASDPGLACRCSNIPIALMPGPWVAGILAMVPEERPEGRTVRRHAPPPRQGFPPTCDAWSGRRRRGTG